MKQWFLDKKLKVIRWVKLEIYKFTLAVMRKLRIYHTTNLIADINSKEGMWWNEYMLLRLDIEGDMGKLLYCLPGNWVNLRIVRMEDLITGTADLDRPDKFGKYSATILEKPHPWGSISAIGTFGVDLGYKPMTLEEEAEYRRRAGIPNPDFTPPTLDPKD